MIQSAESWDGDFFQTFVEFKNNLYRANPNYLEESLTEFSEMWGEGSAFAGTQRWWAGILFGADGRALARVLLSFSTENHAAFAALGYLEATEVASGIELVTAGLNWLKAQPGVPATVRGPLQGHFFNNYRAKIKGDKSPFFGEPLVNDIAMEIWRGCGFAVAGLWHTIRLEQASASAFFLNERFKKIQRRWDHDGIQIRPLNLKTWPSDLHVLYELISDSFAAMPNYQVLSWPNFLLLYDKMKYLLRPQYCLLAERNGQAEGFVIAIPDPLPVLIDLQRRARKWPWLLPLLKLATLRRLKVNRSRLLVLYVGRKTGSKTHWLTLAMGQRITQTAIAEGYQSADICYLSEGSPAYVGLPAEHSKIATYALFARSL